MCVAQRCSDRHKNEMSESESFNIISYRNILQTGIKLNLNLIKLN